MRASCTGFAAAMAEATPFVPGLLPVWTKPLTAARRDAGNLSSNGGLVVLREAARRLDSPP